MRTPDVGTNRGADIKFRCTASEIEALDAKRGSITRSAWLRAAMEQWDGPSNGSAALLPKPPMAEPDIPMADGKTPGLVEVRTPGSSPPPVASEDGKPHRHRVVTENIARYDKGRAVKLMVCACGHSWER